MMFFNLTIAFLAAGNGCEINKHLEFYICMDNNKHNYNNPKIVQHCICSINFIAQGGSK